MKRSNPLLTAFVSGSLSLPAVACATAPEHETPVLENVGPQARELVLPGEAGPGQPKEVKVILDEAPVKLASVILRQGTILPEHDAPVPVTIVALAGSGVVTVGTERLRLDIAHAVFLGAKVRHAVIPEPGTDLVLIIHHLGRSAEHHP